MHPGPHHAITDVPGIRVGHATREEPGWLTGTTVVVPPVGTTAGVDVRGGGPGTRETDLLDPRNLVDAVDAIVLSGGSAFGLSTADGVATTLADEGRGWPLGGPGQVVPIVPAAILFDLGRAGTWRHHPGPDEGRAAHLAAVDGPVVEGGVGAGTGASAGGLRGGIGSASLVLDSGVSIGALVAVNAVGSPLGGDGRLLGEDLLLDGEVEVPDPDPAAVREHLRARVAQAEAALAGGATTLAVVATDAHLDKSGCSMLARVAHDGFARALSPVHTSFDGDTVFAVATGDVSLPEDFAASTLDQVAITAAAADALSLAVIDAHVAGVQKQRVLGRAHRRHVAGGVTGVAFAQFAQHHVLIGAKLQRAAAGADGIAGGDVKLHLSIRADHRADVATIQHGAGFGRRETALKLQQSGAHLGDGGDAACGLPGLGAAQVGALKVRRLKPLRGLDGIPTHHAHGPVKQAGVKMRKAEMRRQSPRKRALSRGCRAVDGDGKGHGHLGSWCDRLHLPCNRKRVQPNPADRQAAMRRMGLPARLRRSEGGFQRFARCRGVARKSSAWLRRLAPLNICPP